MISLILLAYLLAPRIPVPVQAQAMTVVATAYTSNDPGCNEITATGRRTRYPDGRHKPGIAVDPRVIKLGSRVSLDGGRSYILADDVGPAIRGKRIDVRLPDRHAAITFGRRKMVILVRRKR